MQNSLSSHFDQIFFSSDQKFILMYGNSLQGQSLGFFENDSLGEKKIWQYLEPYYADYAPTPKLTGKQIIVGFEDRVDPASTENPDRHSHLFGLDLDGKMQWEFPLATEEGGYLFVQGEYEQISYLAVATDDGVLRAYRIIR